MSARQAFIPRPPSCTPSSETHPHSTDASERDGDRDIFVKGPGKPRSITAFLGQKRGTGIDAGTQGTRPTQGPGLGRSNTSMVLPRRSFEGIVRPEMTPMSIIPYPATTQQPGAGQTPRKVAGQGAFPKPMTPASLPRGLNKGFGIFAEGRNETTTPDENTHGNNSNMFMGPGGDANVRVSSATEIGGYMRGFEESGSGRSAGGVQSSLERDITAPVPGRAHGGFSANMDDLGCEADNIFARSSRPLDAMSEPEIGMERCSDSQRSFGGTKRGVHPEETEENGWYSDESHPAQGSAKRMKQRHHRDDPDEYLPISSPHIPPTPALPVPSLSPLDPTVIAGSLFGNIEQYVDLGEIAADWKRWSECSTEEWLKGADELAQEYTDILNMVKDHITAKVTSYANMISSVEEKRTEVNRNIEIIHKRGDIVRENISRLGTKK